MGPGGREIDRQSLTRLINQYGCSCSLSLSIVDYSFCMLPRQWTKNTPKKKKKKKKKQIILIHRNAVGSRLDMNGLPQLPAAFRRPPIFRAEDFVAGRICKRGKKVES